MPVVGDKIYSYEIILDFRKDCSSKVKNEYKVLGINEKRLVLDDNYFTKLDLKKESYNSNQILNRSSSWHYNFSKYKDEVLTQIYTTDNNSKRVYKKLKVDTGNFLYEKFGKYCKGTDLLENLNIEGEN